MKYFVVALLVACGGFLGYSDLDLSGGRNFSVGDLNQTKADSWSLPISNAYAGLRIVGAHGLNQNAADKDMKDDGNVQGPNKNGGRKGSNNSSESGEFLPTKGVDGKDPAGKKGQKKKGNTGDDAASPNTNCTEQGDNQNKCEQPDVPTNKTACGKYDAIADKRTDEELMDIVQRKTLKYFWEGADLRSGMIKERMSDAFIVTTGGTGFGVMTLLVGIERGWLQHDDVLRRMGKLISFLKNDCTRYHGAWPHWINVNHQKYGQTIAFSENDNGADLVDTAFLMQGLLTVKEYFNGSKTEEKQLRNDIQTLYEEIEWTWFTKGTENKLYWHWSPDKGWAMNLPITGWNQALIVYILAASSPTYPITKEVYEQGWALNGNIKNGRSYFGYELPLGFDNGGPLYFAHYSFLGLDPRKLHDKYADYWKQNENHSRINWKYCVENPGNMLGYSESMWGLTASDNPCGGYDTRSPYYNDDGTISPTAALSSMPYTPKLSLDALRFFYTYFKEEMIGYYGFKDSLNCERDCFADSYLAIDQGPILLMIENHRTGLLWDTFMKNKNVQKGLTLLEFRFR